MALEVENEDPKIAALLIRNLREIDAAARHISASLEPMIDNAINATIENWADDAGWVGEYQWDDDNANLWLAPATWRIPDGRNDETYFWFCLYTPDGDDFDFKDNRDYFRITRLLNQGTCKLGFVFEGKTSHFGGLPKWKTFLQSNAEIFQKLGFTYQRKSGTYFRPVALDAEEAAKAIEAEAIDDVMAPLTKILDEIKKVQPELSAMLARAKSEFKVGK